jgi:hypothetical protein
MIRILIVTIVTIVTLTGCSKDVDIADHIDLSKPIELYIRDKADTNSFLNPKIYMLTPQDPRFEQFINWVTENSTDWESTPASYVMQDAIISQGDFHLGYYKNGGIVINYKDKQGKVNQIMKKVNPDDFQFLLKQ